MITRSSRLTHVAYDIRGEIYEQSQALAKQGHQILSLHIGDPAPFGYKVPESIIKNMAANLERAQGYGDAIGLLEAREALQVAYAKRNFTDLQLEDIYVGNGVSELALISLQALLNDGDEVLVPTPDYPLWTSAVNLFGGKTVYYRCDEAANWYPDPEDIRQKITSRTKGIVLINPNNPTGAVYPADVLKRIADIAAEHNLVIFSDEIYDKILYDGVQHTSIATLNEDVICLTFSGLTKNYRVPGFRAGWMIISGPKQKATDYIGGITLLANLRVCGNQQVQFAIKAVLEGHQCIEDLTAPGGRLRIQRDLCYQKISQIPGVRCSKPMGAFYMFGKLNLAKFDLASDYDFVLKLLKEEKVLIVHGTGFNHYTNDHFRVVFLPDTEILTTAINRMAAFLERHQSKKETRIQLGEGIQLK
ncbi:pyridoxal phosphate-dependent aminotransferase [Rhodocytophaga aerolata]|uniref:alanine transaminase n=1 Tax=Rhodocytophaga aerolata TaxID=455078 RepID=A0ABT8QZ88_9BACT|nr:pyridoxal phosphate-dependent aminotransferase [Rhodocytophaga aerolata]MDO1445158.1 pyridoxal phosphate-dependent aminotransferase [Rhodocytophaga aerolata]